MRLISIIKQIKTAISLLVLLTILTGLLYPVIITAIGQLLFPWKANGSMLQQNGRTIGSELIGQSFTAMNYFWGRPSATPSFPYNATSSTGSNLGPSNPAFFTIVKKRIEIYKQVDLQNTVPIPIDLVTASGSGLDPEISPAAAFYQIPRIAKARGLSAESIRHLIKSLLQRRTFGFLGEPRVNVLELNMALDRLQNQQTK